MLCQTLGYVRVTPEPVCAELDDVVGTKIGNGLGAIAWLDDKDIASTSTRQNVIATGAEQCLPSIATGDPVRKAVSYSEQIGAENGEILHIGWKLIARAPRRDDVAAAVGPFDDDIARRHDIVGVVA